MISVRQTHSLDLEALRDLIVAHYATLGLPLTFSGITFEVAATGRGDKRRHVVKAMLRIDTANAPIGTPTRAELDHAALLALVTAFLEQVRGGPIMPAMINVEVDERRRTLFDKGWCRLKGFAVFGYQNFAHRVEDRIIPKAA